jgi:peptidoglycan/LPS O-acetylase OafA/YrhL
MPGLSIVLFATLVLSYLLGGVEEARQTGAKAIAALFQYANWQQISNNDAYWQGFGRVTPLAHMWSLSITEQFYVVWPMLWVALFWVCRRSVAAVTGIMFLLLAGTATIAPLLYDGSNSDRLYLGTETRTVDFIAGAAAAGVVFLLHQHSAWHSSRSWWSAC